MIRPLSTTVAALVLLLLTAMPLFTYAQAGQPPTDFVGFVTIITDIINLLIPAVFAVVLVFFMWKVIDAWILNAGDEQKVEAGKQYVLWGVLLTVLMVITWGVVVLIQTSLF